MTGPWELMGLAPTGARVDFSGVDVWYRDDGRLAPGEIAEMYAGLALRMVRGRRKVGAVTCAIPRRSGCLTQPR